MQISPQADSVALLASASDRLGPEGITRLSGHARILAIGSSEVCWQAPHSRSYLHPLMQPDKIGGLARVSVSLCIGCGPVV